MQKGTTNGEDTEFVGGRQTTADMATSPPASRADPSPPDHRMKRLVEAAGHWNSVIEARAARLIVESALDANGWRWNLGLSRWIDVPITFEDAER
jgi:hypothetical protein